MKSEYVHPFVDAAVKIIEESTGTTVKRGLVSLRPSPVPTQEVSSVLGIIGEIEGRLLVDMSKETACSLAARMNGQPMAEYDDLVTSTINEVANMVGGRAISYLNNKGHKLDITPPTLFSGQQMVVSNTSLETVVIPLETDFGLVNINIAIRTKY